MKLAEHALLREYVGRPAILDTNLLLLDWCMRFDRSLLRSFKRLNSFEPEDVVLLFEVLKLFPSRWTTPHVLTEVSNLTNSLPAWIKDSWSAFFAEQIQLIPESYAASSEIALDAGAIRFGLADAALTRLATTHVILTTDWPLTGSLEARGLPVINFNRLREATLFS